MLEDQRRCLGNLDRIAHGLRLAIGNAEQDQRRAFGVALIMPLHRHHLGGLMFERVEPVHIARENLQGRDNRRHPHRHREHLTRVRIGAVFQQVPRPHRTNHEGSRQVGGHHRMDEAIGEAGIEDDIPPAFARQELAVLSHDETDGGLHPAVHAEDPEG